MNLDELFKQAVNDPSKRALFLQTLIKSDVYVMCKEPVNEKNGGIHIRFITTHNPDGKMFIPFFTSLNALQQFAKRYVDYYKINCLRFFDLVQTVSAVLNPNSYGKEFGSKEIKSLLMIAQHLKIKAISYNEIDTISYRIPSCNVEHITRTVSKFLSKQPNVEKAYIADMLRGSEKAQILIVIDMIGSTGKLFVSLSKYLSKNLKLKSNEHICFLSCEQESVRKVMEDFEPFYVRKKYYFEK